MKILISTIIGTFISFTFATAFVVSPSAIGGQRSGQGDIHRIAYTFVTADIPLPDSPGIIAIPEDINDHGVMIANVFNNTPSYALTVEPVKRRSTNFHPTTFNCNGVADSAAYSINIKGQITGNCVDNPSGPSKQFGFVRYRNGTHILLDFPGADHTLAFGINDRGHVVGEYYNPLIPEL